jgi:hypothetical protein
MAGSGVFDSQFQTGVTLAAELSKQIINLSTGILALSVGFAKDVAQAIDRRGVRLLSWAWIFYLLAIIFALTHISALTGALLPTIPEYSLKLKNARLFGVLQIGAFGAAIVCTIIFGYRILKRGLSRSLNGDAPPNPPERVPRPLG